MKELQLYNMYVAEEACKGKLVASSLKYGFITNKPVEGEDLLAINQYYTTNKLDSSSLGRTLLNPSELGEPTVRKIIKQLLHYISGGNYGTQKVEIEGSKFTFDIVQIVSREELFETLKKDIYRSKPLSEEKVSGILDLVNKYKFKIDYTKIKNNEFKVHLILGTYQRLKLDGVTGDDVLRTISYLATKSTLLIKSKSVLSALGDYDYTDAIYHIMKAYKFELSQVFNRHKKLFLTIKKSAEGTRLPNLINQVSKMSKVNHVPIKMALNKVFISKYLKYEGPKFTHSMLADLEKLTVVDKMKLITALDVIKAEPESRVFVIRNGKAFIKDEKVTYSSKYKSMYNAIMLSLAENLSFLKGKTIKYPENIDYALPISEKKSVGNIPFGTIIYSTDPEKLLVAGMYWENRWGADDLDLSSVAITGHRTGWGQVESYGSDVLFSGDITNAPDGAIEYIANKEDTPAVLVNNIYNGDNGSKFKIIVGETTKVGYKDTGRYLDKTLIEVASNFSGSCKNMTLGALYKDKFIVYPLALGSKHVSSKKDKAILPYMLVNHLRMKELLELSGVNLVFEGTEFDLDLSIENMTFDKLSNLFVDEKVDKLLKV